MAQIIAASVIAFLVGALACYAVMTSMLARAKAQTQSAEARAVALSNDREQLSHQFRVLSEDSLAAHRQRTQDVVDPLTRTLEALNQRITDVEVQRAEMSAELSHHIVAMRREATALSTALRTPQVRGAWGEQSLRRVIEISGLTERCDFDQQPSYSSDDGVKRPDLRVNLVGGKTIFVDSKVPLSAVLDAYNTEDQALQQEHLNRFAKNVRTHIEQLSAKQYWALDLGSPEFVVLYLASDEFYRLALERSPELHDFASQRGIMLACPGTLIPLLHIVAHGWKQESLAESAQQIARLGHELHQRIATMGGHLTKLQRSLNSSVVAYNQTVASMESRVMVTARKLEALDIASGELAVLEQIDRRAREVLGGVDVEKGGTHIEHEEEEPISAAE